MFDGCHSTAGLSPACGGLAPTDGMAPTDGTPKRTKIARIRQVGLSAMLGDCVNSLHGNEALNGLRVEKPYRVAITLFDAPRILPQTDAMDEMYHHVECSAAG
jgi:hypothetical protein